MKKTIFTLIAILTLCATFAGCGATQNVAQAAAQNTYAADDNAPKATLASARQTDQGEDPSRESYSALAPKEPAAPAPIDDITKNVAGTLTPSKLAFSAPSTNGNDIDDYWKNDSETGKWFDIIGYAESYGFTYILGPRPNDMPRKESEANSFSLTFRMYSEENVPLRDIIFRDHPISSTVNIVTFADDPNSSNVDAYIATTYHTMDLLPTLYGDPSIDESNNDGETVEIIDPSLNYTITAGTRLTTMHDVIKAASDLSIEDPLSPIHEETGSYAGLYKFAAPATKIKDTRYKLDAYDFETEYDWNNFEKEKIR